MGCSTKLSPVLTRNGGDEAEALTVDLRLNKITILCCTAYGPQNNDLVEKKENVWQYIDEEAKQAESEGKGFLLQGDLNAWLAVKLSLMIQDLKITMVEDFKLFSCQTI